MSLDHILLGLLHEPAAGYDLKHRFESEGTRLYWFAELSQIYPALQRMATKGWLSSRRERSSLGPARRVYTRTPTGESALFDWIADGPSVGTDRIPYIGQLIALGQMHDLAASIRFVERLAAHFRARHDRLVAAVAYYESLDDDASSDPDGDLALHELLAVRLGERSLRGRVEACDEALDLLHGRLRQRTRPGILAGDHSSTRDHDHDRKSRGTSTRDRSTTTGARDADGTRDRDDATDASDAADAGPSDDPTGADPRDRGASP